MEDDMLASAYIKDGNIHLLYNEGDGMFGIGGLAYELAGRYWILCYEPERLTIL